MSVASPKKWIKGAIKRPGAFTKWAKGKGFRGVTGKAISSGIKKGGRIEKEAVLARTLRRIGRKRKRG